LGKKKDINEEEIKDTVLPVANDVPGVATRLLDFDRVLMKYRDNHERLCRIRSEMKKRVWTRIGGIVLASPWDFQSHKRSDAIWRYRKPQAERLRKNEYCSIKWGEL
jgi:initiation factor 1A